MSKAMMEAVRTSETSVHFNVATRRYIQEDSILHTRHRENLKSNNFNEVFPPTPRSSVISPSQLNFFRTMNGSLLSRMQHAPSI
jgi:hypothetical protein